MHVQPSTGVQLCFKAIARPDGLVCVEMTVAARSRRAGLTGIVLAGGKSQRIGRNKAFLELEGKTLIACVLERLARLCDELIISTNEAEPYKDFAARIVPDIIPGRGALSGIHAGLTAMRNSTAIVVACDMPFLSLPLLRFMAAISPGYDVVVPRLGEYYEPLHAIYSRNCLAAIDQMTAEGPQRIVALYESVLVREVTEEQVRLFGAEHSFLNVNTSEDWAKAQRIATTW